MRLIIAGGGTGGHLYPGLALAEELLSRPGSHEVLFLGAAGGLEESVVPAHGYNLELLPSLKGGFFGFDFARKTTRLVKGYFQARRALLSFKPDAVVGLGGYASALPMLASWGVEVPALMLEQNAIPGRTTRRLARFATEVGLQFDEGKAYLKGYQTRLIGNPLRRRLVEAAEAARGKNLELRPALENPCLLVLGGSQGARFLNEITVKMWPRLASILPGVRINLLTGKDGFHQAEAAFNAAGVRGRIMPFCDQMEALYAQADVVLARAGATSLAEIAAFALPAVLVPYPHAADDHQTANARVFQQARAAWLLTQDAITPERLAQRVADSVLQPTRRQRMAAGAASLGRPYAAGAVLDRLEVLAGLRQEQPAPLPAKTGATPALATAE
jgi:UDP-N-acetylglucosamine--N-acetylmuramyl-(pentapeptide) pyrophosphoryl-undecaprenol N-acetylglucosamine transferase